jgi:hypothetical protein
VLRAQVSISGQALVFVVRTQGYSLLSRAGLWTYIAFFGAQVRGRAPVDVVLFCCAASVHAQPCSATGAAERPVVT